MLHYKSKPSSANWIEDIYPKIKNGYYKLPKFQREYVWSLENAAQLVDSIIKGFPIGTFILWKSKDRLRSIKELGGQVFPEPEEGSEVYYVLDGQQRITSIYSALKGVRIKQEHITQDFSEIYIDLEAQTHEDIVKVRKHDTELTALQVPLLVISDGGREYMEKLSEFIKADNQEMCDKLDKYKQQLQTGYTYSIIQIENTPTEIATDIFTRINVGGKKLSLFEIMCAKTYVEPSDSEKGFDLYEKYESLVETLKTKEFETIESSAILQVVSAIITGKVDKKSILSIQRNEFMEKWDASIHAICKTIDFFRFNLGVHASRILPYDSLLVPFSYYFYHNTKGEAPTGNIKSWLESIFWHSALSEAYSGSSNDEIHKDILRVRSILVGEKPEFEFTKASLINKEKIKSQGEFRPSRSFIKAILCVFSIRRPRSINDGGEIQLENDYLVQANSKQYHHFWPKNYLKKKNDKTGLSNNIANIIFLDGRANRELSDNAPDVYMKKLKAKNDNFQEILESNLLPEFGWGSKEDHLYHDFERFIDWRIEKIMNRVRETIKSL